MEWKIYKMKKRKKKKGRAVFKRAQKKKKRVYWCLGEKVSPPGAPKEKLFTSIETKDMETFFVLSPLDGLCRFVGFFFPPPPPPPPDGDRRASSIPSIKSASTNLYTWVERGVVRVKCPAQEHNTISLARARFGGERTNHEAPAPPLLPFGTIP